MTGDGSPSVYSHLHHELFHSSAGAVQESIIVYMRNGLLEVQALNPINILELGFGTGLNCLLSYVYGDYHGYTIHYHAYELHPLSIKLSEQIDYSPYIKHAAIPHIWNKIHAQPKVSNLEISKNFHLTRYEQSFNDIADLHKYDLIYHDAFSPDVQAQYWKRPFVDQLFDSLRPGGVLATYCAKGSFKRALKEVGFKVEGRKGPPQKREITVAMKT